MRVPPGARAASAALGALLVDSGAVALGARPGPAMAAGGATLLMFAVLEQWSAGRLPIAATAAGSAPQPWSGGAARVSPDSRPGESTREPASSVEMRRLRKAVAEAAAALAEARTLAQNAGREDLLAELRSASAALNVTQVKVDESRP